MDFPLSTETLNGHGFINYQFICISSYEELKSVMLPVVIKVLSSQLWHWMATCNRGCHTLLIINGTLINHQTHIHVCLMASQQKSAWTAPTPLANSFSLTVLFVSLQTLTFCIDHYDWEKEIWCIEYEIGKKSEKPPLKKWSLMFYIVLTTVNNRFNLRTRPDTEMVCMLSTGFQF